MESWLSSSSPRRTWAKLHGAASTRMGPVAWWTPSSSFNWIILSSRWWAMKPELSGHRLHSRRSFSLQSLSRKGGQAPKSFLSTMIFQSPLTKAVRSRGLWITWCNEGYFLPWTVCVISCDDRGWFLTVSPFGRFFYIYWDFEAFHMISSRVIGVEGHLNMGVPK